MKNPGEISYVMSEKTIEVLDRISAQIRERDANSKKETIQRWVAEGRTLEESEKLYEEGSRAQGEDYFCLGNYTFHTRHYFFKDGSDIPVSDANDGDPAFLDTQEGRKAWRQWRDSLRNNANPKSPHKEVRFISYQEQELGDRIAQDLTERNIPFQRETGSLPYGRLDFLVLKPLAIIELKRDTGPQTMKMAIGQLFFYKSAYPEARLYIATCKPISESIRNILNQSKIEEWKIGKSPD